MIHSARERFSCGAVTATKPFSHRGRAVTAKEREVVTEMRVKESERRALSKECEGQVFFGV